MEAVDQGGTRSGGKRRPSPTAGDGKRKKRRFVWGDDLHAAFQTAIFDVGLRAATVHAVAGELPAVAPGEHGESATHAAPRHVRANSFRDLNHHSVPVMVLPLNFAPHYSIGIIRDNIT